MRLMLAIHLQEGAEALVAEGAKWAERMGAVLDVATVDEYIYNLYLVDDPAVRTVLDGQWKQVQEHAEGRLAELHGMIPAAQRGQALYLTGRAAEEVVATGNGYDAILIGTHGRRGLSHLLLGSVAERVVRSASVPVVVLRLPAGS